MQTSFAEIARQNRVIALDTLRRKVTTVDQNADVLCLRTMRQNLKETPVFVSSRADHFEERLAA